MQLSNLVESAERSIRVGLRYTVRVPSVLEIIDGKLVYVDGEPMIEWPDELAGIRTTRALHSVEEAVRVGKARIVEQAPFLSGSSQLGV